MKCGVCRKAGRAPIGGCCLFFHVITAGVHPTSRSHPAAAAYDFSDRPFLVFLLVPTGRAGLADMPDPADVERVFEEMADLVGKAPFAIKTTEGHHFRRVMIQRKGSAAKSRPGMRSPLGIRDGRGVMFISHTGAVSPSGFLPMDCGNVKTTDPAEIYRKHPLFVSLRDNDALGGKCGICEFRPVCGGSRARAFGVHGDPFAADPACIYQPKNFIPEIT